MTDPIETAVAIAKLHHALEESEVKIAQLREALQELATKGRFSSASDAARFAREVLS